MIAFPQAGLLREPGSADVLAGALEQGADVVGGIDPCSLDRDPVQHLDMMDRSPDRTVVHRGRVVADGLQLV